MHWTDEQLGAYVDGELPPGEAAAVRAHLVQCPGCRGAVTMLERMNDAVREAAAEPSPDFEARTLAKLRALPMPRRPWPSVLGVARRRFMPALAAASLVALVAIGYRGLPTGVRTAPLDDIEVAEQADFLDDMELLEDLEVLEGMDEVPG